MFAPQKCELTAVSVAIPATTAIYPWVLIDTQGKSNSRIKAPRRLSRCPFGESLGKAMVYVGLSIVYDDLGFAYLLLREGKNV